MAGDLLKDIWRAAHLTNLCRSAHGFNFAGVEVNGNVGQRLLRGGQTSHVVRVSVRDKHFCDVIAVNSGQGREDRNSGEKRHLGNKWRQQVR